MRYSIFSVNDHHPRLPRTVPDLYRQVMRHADGPTLAAEKRSLLPSVLSV